MRQKKTPETPAQQLSSSTLPSAPSAAQILGALEKLAKPSDAATAQCFFKTGPGQYGEGDVFMGVRMPVLRKLVRDTAAPILAELERLLADPRHEARMCALLFLCKRYAAAAKTGDTATRKEVFDFYLAHTSRINNWDLVDVSCGGVVGEHLLGEADRSVLGRLAESENLWEQRIAIVSTWAFIRRDQFGDTLALAERLLAHKHDLMHKATGWMLREVGKRDRTVLEAFLAKHCRAMPRTALRYALEHFTETQRKKYMTR
ncbi:MAG: DNA alkylation repair protein [Puniceicoccales bacterium]|jgi:3-methyladenine DNA glycosylase AlkD|nr:DNA alkylation repair protein [Puniceicoccales bacterium]